MEVQPPSLASSTSAEAVASWLERNLHEPWAADAAAAARENSDLTGTSLLNMSEAEAAAALRLTIFGRKRKLTLLLQDAKHNRSAAEATASLISSGTSASSAAASNSSTAAASAAAIPSSLAAAGPSSSSSPDPLHEAALDAATCEQALQDETYALGLVQWSGGKLHELLSSSSHAAWAAPGLRAARLAELASLREQTQALPGVSIVVVGNTGAGKSTLLNALLGESNVLPTNGMRACTAVRGQRHELDAC